MPTTTRKAPVRRRAAKPAPKPVVTEAVAVEEPAIAPVRTHWVLTSEWDKFEGPEYFYDGHIEVHGGVARVPLDKTGWVQRLLFSGYRFADPRDEIDYDALTEA